jgi:hypothetical protein
MRFRVRLLFIVLWIGIARLRVGKGLNKCENEGSSVHDPSDEVSEAMDKAPETTGCKNGLAAPDAPTGASASDLPNEANGFAEAMFTKKCYKLKSYYFFIGMWIYVSLSFSFTTN